MRGLVLLVATLVRRLLREPLVLRSLVFPVGITAGVLLAFLAFVAVVKAPPVVAVPPGYDGRGLDDRLAPYDLRVAEFEDPVTAVRWGLARAGTDGATLWTRGPTLESALVEKELRALKGSRWQRDADNVRPVAGGKEARDFGRRIARMLGSIFTLYGAVFGAGMIARDRDDGSLGVEFTLPMTRWLPGFARYVAGTIVLAAFLVPSMFVLDALVGVPHVGAMCRIAVASASASAGLGLATMAQTGPKGGFAGPLGFALVAAFGALLSGRFVPELAPFLPIGSLWYGDGSSGWVPLALAGFVGAFGAWRVSRMEVG